MNDSVALDLVHAPARTTILERGYVRAMSAYRSGNPVRTSDISLTVFASARTRRASRSAKSPRCIRLDAVQRPQVAGALELIRTSAGHLDAARLPRFITAFQSVTPLTIGEPQAI